MSAPNRPVLLTREPASGLALWNRAVLLQVRRGALTVATIDSAAAVFRNALASGRPVGALLVVEAGAPIPDDETRQAQRTLLRHLGTHEQVRVAPVILGDDLTSTLQRSAGRMVAVGNPRIQRFDSVDLGAAWLARELSALGVPTSQAELTAALEHLRSLVTAG